MFNLFNYGDALHSSAIIEGINTSEFLVRQPYGGTNLLVCDTKNLLVNINGTLSVSSFGISGLPNSIISTNSIGTFEALGIGSNLQFNTNVLSTVASPVFTNITGTLLTAAQPNITSLGTLTGLTVNGSLYLPTQTANSLLYTNGSEIVSSVTINSPLTFSAGTLALNYNSTNLKLTSSAINTIQDISTTSSPTFSALTITNAIGTGSINCSGNVLIGGNLTVNGTTTTVNSSTLSITDNFIQVANQNSTTDTLDIGIFGEYYSSAAIRYCGLARINNTNDFHLFKNLTVKPTSTVSTSDPSYQLADMSLGGVYANVGYYSTSLTVSSLTNSILSTNGSGLLQALTIGNGLSFATNTLAAAINTTNLQFTAGQINTSQNINTTASPTFNGLTLTPLTSQILSTNTSGVLEGLIISNGLSFGSNSLSANINTTNLQFTTGQINTIQNISTSSSPTFSGLTLSGLTTGRLLYNVSGVIAAASTSSNLSFVTGTLDTVQNIQTSSSPTFNGLTLSGLTSNILSTNSSGLLEALSISNGLSFSSNTLSAAINTSNLKFTSGAINTIQDITTSSSPTFQSMTLNGMLNITNSTGIPAGTGYTLYATSGYASPVIGRIYCGDGTGWKLYVSKRASSTDTDLFTFRDNGNFGIGDAAPACGLSVASSNAQIGFSAGTTAPANGLIVSGNVGIGTSSPSCKLNVYGTSGSTSTVVQTTDSTSYAISNLSNDGAHSCVWFLNGSARGAGVDGGNNCATIRNDAGDLRLQSAGGLGLFVTNTSGYVGILNNAPSYTLDVAGTMHTTGTYTNTGGNITVQGNNYMKFGSGGGAFDYYSTILQNSSTFTFTAAGDANYSTSPTTRGGDFLFVNQNNTGAGGSVVNVNSMFINRYGQVGIGTQSFSYNTFTQINPPTTNAIGLVLGGTLSATTGQIGSYDTIGFDLQPTIKPSGASSYAVCQYIYPYFDSSLATSTTLPITAGLFVGAGNVAGGTVTNSYGIYVMNPNFGTNRCTAYFQGSVSINATTAANSSYGASSILDLRSSALINQFNMAYNASATNYHMMIGANSNVTNFNLVTSYIISSTYTNAGSDMYLSFNSVRAPNYSTQFGIPPSGQLTPDLTLRSGNVGIGTVSPAANGFGLLTLNGASGGNSSLQMTCSNVDTYPVIQMLAFGHGNAGISFDAYYDGSDRISSATYAGWRLFKNGSTLNVVSYPAGTAGTVATATTQATWTTTGYGLGTTTPAALLHLNQHQPVSAASSNPIAAQCIIGSDSGRMYLGDYYTGGVATYGSIQCSDYYSSADHACNLILNPLGGAVGIGVTSPSSLLHVNSSGASTDVRLLLTDATTGTAFNNGLALIKNSAEDGFLLNYSNAKLYLGVNNTLCVTLATNYNVGVNDTAPGSKLSVVGNTQIGFTSGTTAPSNGLIVSGQVGIGTSSPDSRYSLDVTGNVRIGSASSSVGYLTIGNATVQNNMIELYPGNSGITATNVYGFGINSSTLRYNTQGDHAWFQSGTEFMRIKQTTGYVGIGTSSPSYALDVTGTIRGTNMIVSSATNNALLYANGSNQLTSVAIGSNLTFSGGTLSALGGGATYNSSFINNNSGLDTYVNIGNLPTDNGSNYAYIHFTVSLSPNWYANLNYYLDVKMANRGGFYYEYSASGSAITSYCTLRAYKQTDGSVNIYVFIQGSTHSYCTSTYTVLEALQVTYTSPNTSYTTPTGTLVFDAYSYPPTIQKYSSTSSTPGNVVVNGNLGIGTSSPGAPLEVHQDGNANNYQIVKVVNNNTSSGAVAGITIATGAGSAQGQIYVNSTTGGTDPNGFFIKNLVNAPLVLGINNSEYMRINTGGNVGIGTNSPATTLQVNGVSSANSFACYSGSSGNTNQAFGYQALNSISTGTDNTAVGYQALNNCTTGICNQALGYQALSTCTTGANNTAMGYLALNSLTAQNDNVAVGAQAMQSVVGNYNTALGYQAMQNATSVSKNTAVGYQSLLNVSTGSPNTALGAQSGNGITTGTQNLCIGYGADVNSSSATNRIAIGYGQQATADNSCFISNVYSANVTGNLVSVNSSGQLGSSTYQPLSYCVYIAAQSGSTGTPEYTSYNTWTTLHFLGAIIAVDPLSQYNYSTGTLTFLNPGVYRVTTAVQLYSDAGNANQGLVLRYSKSTYCISPDLQGEQTMEPAQSLVRRLYVSLDTVVQVTVANATLQVQIYNDGTYSIEVANSTLMVVQVA